MALTLLTPPSPRAAALKVWYTRCPVPSAWGVALRAGKFHEEFADDPGIEFRSVLDSKDPAVHDAHYYGRLDNAFRLGGNIPPIWARSRGADTRVVGISWTTTPSPILALPSAGIRSAADLKGRRLLVIRRPDEEIDFLHAGTIRNYETALATAGLTLDDAVLVEKVIDGSTEHSKPSSAEGRGRPRVRQALQRQLLEPLLKGEVDAVATQGPAAVALIDGFDAHVVHDISLHPDPVRRIHNSVPKLLTVDAGLVERRPDVVARVLARLLEAAAWARENVAATTHFIAQEQGVSDALIEAAYGDNLAPELELNLSAGNLARIEAQKAFLLRRGYIEKDFELSAWIDPRPLEVARILAAQNRRAVRAAPQAASAPFAVGPAGCVAR